MIDTHAHLYDPQFSTEIDKHILEIKDSGVSEVWLPNCDVESWNQLESLFQAYPDFVLPMIGLHPTYVKEGYLKELQQLKSILDDRKVLAIGEIGLDYYWDLTFQKEQILAFETQCHWALERGLWIDVHCRKAYADLIRLLKKTEYKDLKGIIHCFSGDFREAKTLVDLGYTLGIGGVITYKNTTLFDSIKDISLEHIVLETDAPYLTPVPYRGQMNSPKYIPLIAQKLADLYEMPMESVIQITNENANKLKLISNY
ncbi:MAG: TatD family hydrolase [Aquirufa sp.]|jgi:TatD DNase family protein